MIKNYELLLMQFCDSQFPTGAFSHSFGLETYIQRNEVVDEESFKKWLEIFLNEQLTYSDGIAMRIVFDALHKDDKESILKMDKLLFTQNLPEETRVGSRQMGVRMLTLAIELYDDAWCKWYKTQLDAKKAHVHPAIVFVMIGNYLGASLEAILSHYYYQNIANLTQNAVRAIPLGQTSGQRIVRTMIEKVTDLTNTTLSLDTSLFGLTAPGLEMSQIEHEDLDVRIFIS